MPETEQPQRGRLRKIVNKADSGFLVTQSERGMHGRPMATAQIDENFARLQFATKRTHAKIKEIQADDRVMIGYSSATAWSGHRSMGVRAWSMIARRWANF